MRLAIDRRLGLALLLALMGLILVGSRPYFGRLMNANERPRILQAISLVDGAGWAIDDVAADIDPGIDVSRSPAGALYPNKAPGTSVVAGLGVAVERSLRGEQATLRGATMWARLFCGVLPTLLFMALAVRRIGRVRPVGAVLAVVLTVLATPVFSYAKLAYGHTLAMFLLYAGCCAIIDAPRKTSRELWAVLGGLCCALAVCVEYTAAFAGVPIAMLLILRARRNKEEGLRALAEPALALAGALVGIAALLAYHQHAFGGPFRTPYHYAVDPSFASVHGRGLLGLSWPTRDTVREHLLSPWGGLVVWAPVALVAYALLVFGAIRRRLKEEEWLWLGIFTVLLLVNLGLAQRGGWRVGPRYLVLALPMVAHGLAFGLSGFGEGLARPTTAVRGWVLLAIVATGTIGLLSNALAATLFPHLVPRGEPITDQLLPLLWAGHSPYGLPVALILALVGLLFLATVAATVLEIHPRARGARTALEDAQRRRPLWIKAVLGGLVGLGLWAPRATGEQSAEGTDLDRTIADIWEPDGSRPTPEVLLPRRDGS